MSTLLIPQPQPQPQSLSLMDHNNFNFSSAQSLLKFIQSKNEDKTTTATSLDPNTNKINNDDNLLSNNNPLSHLNLNLSLINAQSQYQYANTSNNINTNTNNIPNPNSQSISPLPNEKSTSTATAAALQLTLNSPVPLTANSAQTSSSSSPSPSLSHCMDDLCSRFLLNVPDSELESWERVIFQCQEAYWFYCDFYSDKYYHLPKFSFRAFCLQLFKHCPLLSYNNKNNGPRGSSLMDKIFTRFQSYLAVLPVCGAILLNVSMDKVVMVKGWKGNRWGFPRGKKDQNEGELECACREVKEEIGFDIRPFVSTSNEPSFIEANSSGKIIRLYIIPNIPEDIKFSTQTRKEISSIEWIPIEALPTPRESSQSPFINHSNLDENKDFKDESNNSNSTSFKFGPVFLFAERLRRWIKKQKKSNSSKPNFHNSNNSNTLVIPDRLKLNMNIPGPLLVPVSVPLPLPLSDSDSSGSSGPSGSSGLPSSLLNPNFVRTSSSPSPSHSNPHNKENNNSSNNDPQSSKEKENSSKHRKKQKAKGKINSQAHSDDEPSPAPQSLPLPLPLPSQSHSSRRKNKNEFNQNSSSSSNTSSTSISVSLSDDPNLDGSSASSQFPKANEKKKNLKSNRTNRTNNKSRGARSSDEERDNITFGLSNNNNNNNNNKKGNTGSVGWDAEEMFRVNEKNFGLKSSVPVDQDLLNPPPNIDEIVKLFKQRGQGPNQVQQVQGSGKSQTLARSKANGNNNSNKNTNNNGNGNEGNGPHKNNNNNNRSFRSFSSSPVHSSASVESMDFGHNPFTTVALHQQFKLGADPSASSQTFNNPLTAI